MRSNANHARDALQARHAPGHGLQRKLGGLRRALRPEPQPLRVLHHELHRLRAALPGAQPSAHRAGDVTRQAVRREAGKAATATVDAMHRVRDWILRHLPWRRRTPVDRLRQRVTEVAHRA
jgi:hypothetical protein